MMKSEEKKEIVIEPLEDEEDVKPNMGRTKEKKQKNKYTVSQKVIDRNNLARKKAIQQRMEERMAYKALNTARELVKREKKVEEPVRDEAMLLAKSKIETPKKEEQEIEPSRDEAMLLAKSKKEEPKKRACRKDRFH